MSKKDEAIKQIEKRLKEPFPAFDIEWRVQRSGQKEGKVWAMVLAYVTARAIQDRLDETCGAFGWRNTYKEGPNGGVLCGISIADSEGKWITKWDGAENTNIEAVKGGLSGAFKRAGSAWGIGRYLYKLSATFATIADSGQYSSQVKNGPWFKWNPPTLPKWALPEGEGGAAPQLDEPEPPITYEELSKKIVEAKAIPHLANLWKKHAEAMGKMSEQERKDLAILKDTCKNKLADAAKKAAEADAIAQDAARGEG
jgi:hypothetical protein